MNNKYLIRLIDRIKELFGYDNEDKPTLEDDEDSARIMGYIRID